MKSIGELLRPGPKPPRPPEEDAEDLAVELADELRKHDKHKVPWQVPLCIELASKAKSNRDRAGFLRRALNKLKAVGP